VRGRLARSRGDRCLYDAPTGIRHVVALHAVTQTAVITAAPSLVYRKITCGRPVRRDHAGCRRWGRTSPYSGEVAVNQSLRGGNREVMDDDLIAAIAGGDDAALRELFARHAPWLAVRLRSMLPAADVEDVLQETFVAVWRGAGGYCPQAAAGGWLWGIARRQAALWLRRRGPSTLAPLPDAVISSDASSSDAHDPAEIAGWRADIETALAELGPPGSPEREVWRLLFVEDRTVADVAARTGVAVGTVKSRAFRVRRVMRRALRGGIAEGGIR
jgi:RNA polymerase sigma-70 factor, ECF subfamily